MTNTNIGHERLRTLYSVMSGIPKPRVALWTWFRGNRQKALSAEHECGTTCCAVGYACLYPEFNEQGLEANGANYPIYNPRDSLDVSLTGWDAAEVFFGLPTRDDALALFQQGSCGYKAGTNIPLHALYADSEFAGMSYFQITDKVGERNLVLMRIRNYLTAKGVTTPERNRELAAIEKELP